jgi:hypothetical protein
MDHLTDSDVEGFVNGALPPDDQRRVVRHLVAGCAACGRKVSSAFPPSSSEASMRRRNGLSGFSRSPAAVAWRLPFWPNGSGASSIRRSATERSASSPRLSSVGKPWLTGCRRLFRTTVDFLGQPQTFPDYWRLFRTTGDFSGLLATFPDYRRLLRTNSGF